MPVIHARRNAYLPRRPRHRRALVAKGFNARVDDSLPAQFTAEALAVKKEKFVAKQKMELLPPGALIAMEPTVAASVEEGDESATTPVSVDDSSADELSLAERKKLLNKAKGNEEVRLCNTLCCACAGCRVAHGTRVRRLPACTPHH